MFLGIGINTLIGSIAHFNTHACHYVMDHKFHVLKNVHHN